MIEWHRIHERTRTRRSRFLNTAGPKLSGATTLRRWDITIIIAAQTKWVQYQFLNALWKMVEELSRAERAVLSSSSVSYIHHKKNLLVPFQHLHSVHSASGYIFFSSYIHIHERTVMGDPNELKKRGNTFGNTRLPPMLSKINKAKVI